MNEWLNFIYKNEAQLQSQEIVKSLPQGIACKVQNFFPTKINITYKAIINHLAVADSDLPAISTEPRLHA